MTDGSMIASARSVSFVFCPSQQSSGSESNRTVLDVVDGNKTDKRGRVNFLEEARGKVSLDLLPKTAADGNGNEVRRDPTTSPSSSARFDRFGGAGPKPAHTSSEIFRIVRARPARFES